MDDDGLEASAKMPAVKGPLVTAETEKKKETVKASNTRTSNEDNRISLKKIENASQNSLKPEGEKERTKSTQP